MGTPYEKDLPTATHNESASIDLEAKKGDRALAIVGDDRVELTQADVSQLSDM